MNQRQEVEVGHRKYFVRTVKAAAGTCLAAATMTGTASTGAAPASAAAPGSPVLNINMVRTVAAVPLVSERKSLPPNKEDRVGSVRQDMDLAVRLGEVTREQADRFTAQIEDHIARER